MASNKTLELRDISDADLQDQLKESTSSLQKMTFDHTVNGIENPLQLRTVRRDVARIKTEIRRRELEALPQEELAKRDNIRRRRRKK
ncbi:large subunit ribosomal protein L29 [Lewinella marina]|uniref:Large ribosomal subunit protein uL29 n=1 Tax=Neolewinella marina TaxID=438751 RepID=A0A2G0CHF4_9BACT|nr:50S ribosomal protein L29 [Neolewinella marina]NJB86113.1 large subunit ribosomal protein L29 [Neolewinella marina]PHK99409.1 50S ribosomal protein L29 [Neolewinella marina]